MELAPHEISRSYRVGRNQVAANANKKPRPIIVKFSSYNARKRFYSARKQLKDCYISEDLTKTRSNLFYVARQERKKGRFLHAWTDDGIIKIRLRTDNRVISITNEWQLQRLIRDIPMDYPVTNPADDPVDIPVDIPVDG